MPDVIVYVGKASQFLLIAPASVKCGAPFSLTLTVEDAYGNRVTNYTGPRHFSSTAGGAKLPKYYTFTAADRGQHTFAGLILRKRGYQKVSLTGSVIVDVC